MDVPPLTKRVLDTLRCEPLACSMANGEQEGSKKSEGWAPDWAPLRGLKAGQRLALRR
jgi:hypothetical protein